jgi:3-phosphoshikimate 1-carboxyvinyltransferase
MMAFPPIKSIEGHVNIPSSKSEAQRALLIAAISEHPIKIYLQEPSDDVLAVIDLLSAIGFGIRKDTDNVEIYFFPTKQPKLTISARESGFDFMGGHLTE